MNAVIYAFGASNHDTRRFIDTEETHDVAQRFHGIAELLDHFDEIDDRGDGLVRDELLRAIRDATERAMAVLA